MDRKPASPVALSSDPSLRRLGELVREAFQTSELLKRLLPGGIARAPSGMPMQLAWGQMNRIPSGDGLALLPRIQRQNIGVPLYVSKMDWGRLAVLPIGPAVVPYRSANIAPSPSGIHAITISRPGLSILMNDGESWYHQNEAVKFDVTIFGASPSAVPARNDAAFEAAKEAAERAGGGTVFVPAGRYRKAAAITDWPANVALEGEGDSSVLVYDTVTTTFVAITCAGTQGTGVALAANATEGTDDLNVASTGFTTDDWVKVYSSAVTGSTNLPKGEICRLSDASTMTLYDPLCDTYNTADTASVAKLELVAGVAFRNFKIEGPSDNSVTFSGILLDRTLGARVEGVTFERCHFYGVAFQDSVDWSAVNVRASKSETGALAYGIAIFNASQDGTISGCRGYRLRHLVTHGGFTSRNGVPRRTVTSNCVASQCRNSGFDAHAGGEDISFDNCTVLGSESDGFTIECASATLSNCRVRDSVGPGFHLNTQSVRAFNVALSNCSVSGKGNAASRSAIQIQVQAGFESFDAITITGGTFLDNRYGVRCINAQTGRIKNLTISGGTWQRSGLDGDAVLSVVHAENVTIAGNTIDDTTNSLDGVSLTDVDGFSVASNTIRLTGTGGCRCVRGLTTTTNGTIEGNKGSAGSSGIGVGLADTCSNVTIGAGNDLRGCPTPLSLGGGRGHRVIQGHGAAFNGDTGVTLQAHSDQEQVWDTTLSNNRTVGLPSGNFKIGFRITRASGAQGAFSLLVGSGVPVHVFSGAGQWCDVVNYGSGYVKTAAGVTGF